MLLLTPDDALGLLRAEAGTLLASPGRHVLGIAGGPGVGKSTLATALVEAIGDGAACVPMDGFHLPQATLEAAGAASDKGMPHTFDAAGFVAFVAALKAATAPMHGPGYSRKIEDVVANAYAIAPSVRLLVVEGNYLLLGAPPWSGLRPLLDRAVFLDLPRELAGVRLLNRHAEAGLFSEERNRAHVERVDLANYDLVMESRIRADVDIRLITGH